jgi:hypothetical protein
MVPYKKGKYHILKPNDLLTMQKDFIFFDTESYSNKLNDLTEEHRLKMGYALYWNRINNTEEWLYFTKAAQFWDFVEEKAKDKSELLIYAHNTDFDFKMTNGLKELSYRKWNLKSYYMNGVIFSLTYKKAKTKLRIYDTVNYLPAKLEKIGESIGLKKMHVDFNKCTDEELRIYCKNDVKIIYLFIKKIIEFLNTYELSKLRATTSSIALNIFRHKFYDYEKTPIHIHANLKAIELERDSYHGAITDCFKIGTFNKKLAKYDINSMYPYQMFKHEYPIKLIYYSQNSKENLKNMMLKYIKEYHIIAKCKIWLPKDKAYILTKIQKDKCGFLWGGFTCSITTPEIEYILKHGKILDVFELAVYEKAFIFKEYVDFFFKKRWEFKDNKNHIFEQLCKLYSNGLYGKFGQHGSNYTVVKDNMPYDLGRYIIYEDKNTNGKTKKVIDYILLHLGDKTVKIEANDFNAYDGFVAIASLVTAYARMYLVELIEIVGRENVYYADTDSLIINDEVSYKLKDFIDNRKLGFLKFEGYSNESKFIRPKWYIFNNETKSKGVKKDAIVLSDDENELVITQNQWQRFNSSIKEKNTDRQIIKKITKHLNKHYDKGLVDKNGDVYPYNAQDIKLIKV